jgi:formylglycine-generating enzyme required for sulfatase activity
MGRGDDNDAFQGEPDERPEHDVTVSDFFLDTFEVTVGRFRKFVDLYDRIAKPLRGDGAHPLVPESGWQASWQVPPNSDQLIEEITCSNHTWTDTPAKNELLPINCVRWEIAFFFCFWDQGRLPTEAEWEYAAAGGSENRLYPWGNDRPDPRRAVFDCMGDGVIDCTLSDILEVGSAPLGKSRWEQYDLAGSVWEWALDMYDAEFYSEVETCEDCANLQNGEVRIVRGGSWNYFDYNLRSVYRKYIPDYHFYSMGIRCARDYSTTQ